MASPPRTSPRPSRWFVCPCPARPALHAPRVRDLQHRKTGDGLPKTTWALTDSGNSAIARSHLAAACTQLLLDLIPAVRHGGRRLRTLEQLRAVSGHSWRRAQLGARAVGHSPSKRGRALERGTGNKKLCQHHKKKKESRAPAWHEPAAV